MDRWVRVEKRRNPSRPRGAWEALVLGEDDLGLSLYAPAGVRNRHNMSGVQLLTCDKWWVAWWWDDPQGRWCAADVCTPVSIAPDRYSYDDLEIDVVGNEEGFLMVVDEDEFEEARASVPYPTNVADAALVARGELVHAMTERIEPFGDTGWRYLTAGTAGR